MRIIRSYKTELRLNNKQRTACVRHAGTARFAYNWGLAKRIEAYKNTGKSPNAIEQYRELTALKKTRYLWMYAVSKCAPQEALRDLDRAFNNFFRRVRNHEREKGFPKFKSRKKGIGSFRLMGTINVFEGAIQLPRLGKLRLKESGYLPIKGSRILSATVSESAGKWYVSVNVEETITVPMNSGPPVGVDVGLKALATLSDETIIENPKALLRHERKLRRQSREVARKEKGSKNRQKAVRKLQRTHTRIRNIRKDTIHKVTTLLAKTKSVIVVENLKVSGLLKNKYLNKAILNVGMYELRRQLEYKTRWYGSKLVVASKFYPSSKTCSRCGHVKDNLELSDRIFACDVCGFRIDRDLNASYNLERLAVSRTESINACKRWGVHDSSQVPVNEARTEHCSRNALCR